jgi:hypothetical protein
MSKHKLKIEKLFEHPLSGNIDSKKLIHALEYYGVEVDKSKHHRALLHFKNQEHSLTLGHRNELSKDSIMQLRHFLEAVGLTPENL